MRLRIICYNGALVSLTSGLHTSHNVSHYDFAASIVSFQLTSYAAHKLFLPRDMEGTKQAALQVDLSPVVFYGNSNEIICCI